MANYKPSKAMVGELVKAGILEALCVIAGLIAWSITGNWIWIVSGVLASLGFSLPALIKLVREAREQDRASR
jgi:hypothetical protein